MDMASGKGTRTLSTPPTYATDPPASVGPVEYVLAFSPSLGEKNRKKERGEGEEKENYVPYV